jgi:hypothetical protein
MGEQVGKLRVAPVFLGPLVRLDDGGRDDQAR